MRIAIAGGTGTIGRHLVRAAQHHDHDVVVLGRETVDLRTGEGADHALRGVDTIVDVTNPGGADYMQAAEFFTDVSATLARIGAQQGVRHIVTLSIVGIERTTFDYFQAKLAHERAAAASTVPRTLLRATQLHEFPAQVLGMTRDGDRASVYDIRVRSVAARTVAQTLLTLAENTPIGRASDLAGPEEADLVDLARRFVAHCGAHITVIPDPDGMSGVPQGALLPGPAAQIAGPTFDEWLDSEDASAFTL